MNRTCILSSWFLLIKGTSFIGVEIGRGATCFRGLFGHAQIMHKKKASHVLLPPDDSGTQRFSSLSSCGGFPNRFPHLVLSGFPNPAREKKIAFPNFPIPPLEQKKKRGGGGTRGRDWNGEGGEPCFCAGTVWLRKKKTRSKERSSYKSPPASFERQNSPPPPPPLLHRSSSGYLC